MVFQPRQIKCIQIRQEEGIAQPYNSFFVTKPLAVKCKQNRFGGGDFEITLPYNQRNVYLFSNIETIPTFIAMGFSLETAWDSEIVSTKPHPMPMAVETYLENHNREEEPEEHTITISGRGVLDVLLSNKVVMPRMIYEDEDGFLPWDLLIDLFGRNVNGENTPDILDPVTVPPNSGSYLTPLSNDNRFVSDVSLLHDIVEAGNDVRIERTYEGDDLLEVFTNYITAYSLYVTGQMKVDITGRLHFDYTIHRLNNLRSGTATPLVYDYGAMPPKTYNKLLSIQELRQIAYVKIKNPNSPELDTFETVTKGNKTDNAKYKGWMCKELFLDGSSLPTEGLDPARYLSMLRFAAADELYKDGSILIKVEDIEYLFSPMDYYTNCWPGCIYTSVGPDGNTSDLVITSIVLTGSKQDGWVITPELSHYTNPYLDT